MKTIVVISSSQLGSGDDELGGRLMEAFLRKIWASDIKPALVIFYNSGVTLLAPQSTVLDALDGLSRAGVDLAACGTCVAHYQLTGRLAVGRVSDMQEIVSLMLKAEKVITV